MSHSIARKARMCLPLETGKKRLWTRIPSLCLRLFPSRVSSFRLRLELSAPKWLAVTALRDSGRKAAESSLALEGAFNWIRLIRLKSLLSASASKGAFEFDRRDNPRTVFVRSSLVSSFLLVAGVETPRLFPSFLVGVFFRVGLQVSEGFCV